MAAAFPISSPVAPPSRLTDSHGRIIHDLRVSITDRCNYKCVYCRTGEFGAQYPELDIAEYLRIIKLFVDLGIEKVRLTGGEPLLRRSLLDLVRELAQLRTLAGAPLDLALTTNGHLLEDLAAPLKKAAKKAVAKKAKKAPAKKKAPPKKAKKADKKDKKSKKKAKGKK